MKLISQFSYLLTEISRFHKPFY